VKYAKPDGSGNATFDVWRMKHPVLLSIDVDEWFHARWATGTSRARWQRPEDVFREVYGSDKPPGEIVDATLRVLDMLDRADVTATFFVLGEVANWYPNLITEIAERGHEIGCHGFHHRDMTESGREAFSGEIAAARQILKSLTGQPINGFRAPNLVIAPWLPEVLTRQGFVYDSSVCPSRSIFGKYKGQVAAPSNPYRSSPASLLNRGDGHLVEVPIPTFPVLRLPGAVSIATRIFGWTWTRITLEAALRNGATSYYTHPYEFTQPPRLTPYRLKERIFMRRTGEYMFGILERFLSQYQGRIMSIRDYAQTNQWPGSI
jgi:peptidoglycan/xylan/chitin deacetylase (PgdA/CDA1 family)